MGNPITADLSTLGQSSGVSVPLDQLQPARPKAKSLTAAARAITAPLEELEPAQPKGPVPQEPGNIDLYNRPHVKNPDGTTSTVRSMSFGENGKEILVPTVSEDGRIMSDEEAVDTYHKTGKHLGIFKSPEDATAYASKLHDDYAAGKYDRPKPASGFSFDSLYRRPTSTPRAENPFGVSTTPAPAKATPTAAAARVTEPQIPLAPPENPQQQSDYWREEWAARERDIEKLNQLEQSRQARQQREQERQAEIAKQPFDTRLVQSMMEPGTALGTVMRQQAPEEPAPQFESDYFKHRVAESAAQGKSVWDAMPRSMTELLVRSQLPHLSTDQARRISAPFEQPLADMPTVTGHTNPVAVGAERALGGFTSPENLALLGALGGLDAAAQTGVGMVRHAPRVVSGLFTTQMGAGLVHAAREYQARKAAGDEEGAQQVLGSAFVQVPLTLLTAYHTGTGMRTPMKAEDLLDVVHAADSVAQIGGRGTERAAHPAGGVTAPIEELQPAPAPTPKPTGQLAPLEVPLDQLQSLPEPQPINPQEVTDLSRQVGRPITAEEVPEIRRRLDAERNIEAGLRGDRRDVAGEIREQHRSQLEGKQIAQPIVARAAEGTAPRALPAPTAKPFRPFIVDEPTAGKILYHGTRSEDFADLLRANPAEFDSGKNIFGPGFYLTDNPDVAASYGQKTSHILAGRLSDVRLLDLEKPAAREFVDAVKAAYPDETFQQHIDQNAPKASGGDLYEELRKWMSDDMLPLYEAQDVMHDLAHQLAQKGFDGFRYEGGKRTGNVQHNAVVLFPDTVHGTSIGGKLTFGGLSGEEKARLEKRGILEGTFHGGLGFLDPKLLRAVMPESIKNALSENVSLGDKEAGIIREKTGELARKREQAFQHYADAVGRWEKRSVQDGRDFILREQRGEKQPNADDQAVADELQKEFAARRKAVEDLTHGSFDQWRENYFPQFWERPNQVADWVAKRIAGTKRPLQGPASFKKARVFDDLQEGINAGFKPVTNNPVTMALLKLHELDRYIMAHEILGQSLEEGLAQYVRFGSRAPEGWTRINDSMFRVLQPSEEAKGMVLRGEYYMPAEAARVLNNYLSPGLRGNPLYDFMRGAGNTLNQAQLGVSGFHAMFSAVNSSISDFALALRKASRLEIPEAAAAAARAATLAASPIRHVVTGTKLMREYLSPGSYAKYSELADAVAKSGGRIYQDPLYRNAAIGQFWKAWKEGDWAGVGLKAFPAALEGMAKPVMEFLVPRLKLGTFADMAREALDRVPAGASKDRVRAALDRAWDSVDNRFGQVVYDNLFVNKIVKDLGLVGVRSLGWNLGTIREIGGAAKDTAKATGRAAIGEKPEVSDRMAYTLALPIMAGYMGAIVNYLYTGKPPEEAKDYFFPRTGRTLPNGEPERISLPTYMKDVFAFAKHPLVTAGHKIHPLLSMVADMLRNEDFYGVEIRHQDDPLVKQVGQLLGYTAEQLSPLSIRNLQQRAKTEGRTGVGGVVREAVSPAGVQSFFGITPAPASVTHTAAEEKALEIMNRRRPQGTRTSAEFEHAQMRSFLRGELSAGRLKPGDLASKVRAGQLSPKEAGELLKQVREVPIVRYTRSLPLEDFLSVWDVASAREREQLRPLLFAKRHLIANVPSEERAAVSARLNIAIDQSKPRAMLISTRR